MTPKDQMAGVGPGNLETVPFGKLNGGLHVALAAT
jgi:hypothetical protein